MDLARLSILASLPRSPCALAMAFLEGAMVSVLGSAVPSACLCFCSFPSLLFASPKSKAGKIFLAAL